MFGSTSTWGQPQQPQPQQQQQSQQQTNAFGQPANAFGGGAGAFGQPAQNAFGQPAQQQQQQPAANPMFGAFGQPAAANNNPPAGGGGFGAFGATNNAAAGPSAFGAPKPAGTFGAFGGTGGGTTAFGATPNAFGATGATGGFGAAVSGSGTTTGAFGQPASTGTNAFGGGGGIFGQAKPAGTFGATTANATAENNQVVTTGSSNPPWAQFDEKDTTANLLLHYQSISCMPAYRGSSFEEIRVQDYAQNRKTANAAPAAGAFGQPAAGGGLFGQQANTAAPGGFGTFGQTTQPTQPAQPAAPAFGAFGQQNPAQQPATGAFGTFGQQAQPAQPAPAFGGGFGQTNPQQPAPAGGLFGGGGATAGGAFGANNGTTNAFGGNNLFGQNQNQPQQQPNTGGGLFGQQPQANPSPFGTFGAANNNAAKPAGGLFGAQNPAQPATNTFGTFGQNSQAQQQPPAGGLFGNTNTSAGGGLFGQNNQQQQPAQPGGLFGTANITQPAQPGTGLFGGGGAFGTNNATNAQPAANNGAFGAGGLFGQKPAAPGGGLFGSTNTATAGTQPAAGGLFGGGGAFGQTNNAATNNTFSGSGSLFGQKPATNGFGTQAAAPAAGNSLFGGGNTSTLNVSALGGGGATAPGPSLTASIAQPIGANLPIFDLLPPGPRSIPLDPPKKKSTLFQDIPTRQPVPRLQLGYVPQGSRLRGFAAPPAASVAGGLAFSSNTRGALAMSTTTAPIGTEAFFGGGTATAALGSGARQSVKKLVLDKKVEPADLFASLGGRAAPGSLKKGAPAAKPAFNAALGIAAREREAADAARGATPSPAPAPKKNAGTVFAGTSDGTSDGEAAREGETADGYWVRPPLAALKALGYERLAALPDLVVGRSGRGEIAFLEPVNLTEVPRLTDLLGGLIEFGEQDCSLYPGYDDADRPPPGQGLNVRARITILGAWPRDRASKAAIKDDKDPLAVKHLKRLKNMKGTHFESYEISEGKWIFTVDHI